MNSLAPGLIIAVAIMLITALTLIPAVIAILSKVMFWPFGPGHERDRSMFAGIGRGVARRPVITATAIGVLLIVLAVFGSGYKATYDTLGEMPSDTPSQQAFDTLAASLPPGELSPTQVYVQADGPIPQNELSTLTTDLSQVDGVAAVTPPRVSSDGTAAVVNVVLADSPFATQSLDTIDDNVRPVAHQAVPGARVAVGGQTATLADVRSQLHSDMRHVFPVAVVIVWVILGALLLAVLAPVNLIVSVFVTFGATLGALVIVFQHLLGYAGIDFSTPIVLYLFVVAIGTDYNILMAERVRETFVAGAAPREAARLAITKNGPTAAAAGVILALTFASLTLTGLRNLEELGAGVAIGVVLASCVMAPMLVPALSVIQRRAFWWPTRPSTPADTGEQQRTG
ncbi:MMPL family transporter [Gordonia sp. PKS22-38]|uniref:MMPL family transporter n=1 Tax=Gordonia prachuapensis TaxID=3115651 RepID=A0ABU7MPD3_9ACTN|nr:MMPL family transporter [Gordonia sp. PKS22-38]